MTKSIDRMICFGAFAALFVMPVSAQPKDEQESNSAIQTTTSPQLRKASPYHPSSVSKHAKDYYLSAWGIDKMLVRLTASNNLIRFSYRVSDPMRAMPLGDDHATPLMYGQRSRALLHIPVMEKVGQLRQTGVADAGKEYWMVFSNKGEFVKSGDLVNVVIGAFHAEGLIVE